MKRLLLPCGLFVLALGASALAFDVVYIEITNKRVRVPVVDGKAPPVFVGDTPTGRVFATGDPAIAITGGYRRERPSPEVPPPPPRLVEILRKGTVLAGLTELIPGSDILIGSRHALQGGEFIDIADSFTAAGLDLSKFGVYELRSAGLPLDAVLFIPREKLTQVLSPEGEPLPDEGIQRYRFGLNPRFETAVKLKDRFFSFQVGTAGNQKTSQVSQGEILAITPERFLLPLVSEGNNTTIRSSGSIVYTTKPSSQEWKIAGIVECVIPASASSSGVPIPGGVQVLPVSEILRSVVSEISLEEILRERPESDPGCIKIDARGGGGG